MNIAKRLIQHAKEHHIPVYKSKQKPAEDLRKENIQFYSNQLKDLRYATISERDARFNLIAYQQMTDAEILQSEQRNQEYSSQKIWQFIQDLRQQDIEAKKHSPNAPRASAA
jgi:hypothetical protein